MNERIPTKAEQYQGLAFVTVLFLAVGAVGAIADLLNRRQQMRLRESGREVEIG